MKTVGLALGSGGARGWAHIGAIRALEAADIKINYIAGASVGALVGAIYCAGELSELEAFIRDLSWKDLISYFDLVFPHSGLLDGNKIYELLSEHMQNMQIEDSEISFCCVATDLIQGKELHLKSGLMVDAVRASISIPGIFTPFIKNNRYLGDGGIVNPVPVDLVRGMGADLVVAVNVNRNPFTGAIGTGNPMSLAEVELSENREAGDVSATQPNEAATEQKQTFLGRLQDGGKTLQDAVQKKIDNWLPDQPIGPNIFDVIGTSLNVMEQRVTRSQLERDPPDLLIEPDLTDYGIFDFHQADAIIRAGYHYMEQAIPELKKNL